jgi:hypothetical protein
MTLEEEMAVCVLKGEKGTALILAQKLMEEHVAGRVELPAIKTLDVPVGTRRLVAILSETGNRWAEEGLIETGRLAEQIRDWWNRGDGSLMVVPGISSLHIYVEPQPDPLPKDVAQALEKYQQILGDMGPK